MNAKQREDLDWLAFRYVAAELSPAESRQFEGLFPQFLDPLLPEFAGWVGRFQVEASASPTEVSIGDPVTLAVSVSGPEYLDNVELPALARSDLVAAR
mgnify:CR=1 FL=1